MPDEAVTPKHHPQRAPKTCVNCKAVESLQWDSFQSDNTCTPCHEYFVKHKSLRPKRLWRSLAPKNLHRCSNCKVQESNRWHGSLHAEECSRCYYYRSLHGKCRPKELWKQDRITGDEKCSNCSTNFALLSDSKHLCRACSIYSVRNQGLLRPQALWGITCGVCGNGDTDPFYSGKHGKRECDSCHTYQIRHGKERPRRYWDRTAVSERKCLNCFSVETSLWHGFKEDQRCHACYQYKRKKGCERPESVWSKPKRRRKVGMSGVSDSASAVNSVST